MRKCPICKIQMGKDWLYNEEVERCGKCNGVFLDEGELGNLVSLMRIYKNVKLSEPEIDTLDEIDTSHNLKSYIGIYKPPLCPSDGNKMSRDDYGGLPVDICHECHGVWLDDGELISLKKTEHHIKSHLNLYLRLAE